MDDKLPRIPDLTPDDRIWRLDWFGDVAYLHGTWQSAQPRLKVVMSPLTGASDDQERLLTPACTDHQHSVETRVPIAALPLLGIGDLWKNGRRVSSPDYTMECFAGLAINDTTTNIIKAGVSEDEKFYLPLSNHPWHRKHTQSYCVMVTRSDGTRIVIPALELIRFYFGSTGNLLQRLFTAPLTKERLWSSSKFSSNTRHLHLTLAAGLSGVSAADIGRIARDKSAWRAAARIFASCQKASVSGDSVYPYTMFPFKGHTDFVASGTWLPFGDQPNSTFLVYRARSCSHPFPFKSMTYEATDKKVWCMPTPNAGTKKKFAKRPAPFEPKSANQDPGNRIQQKRTSVFDVDHRFPDLARKAVWRNRLEVTSAADAFANRAAGETPRPQAFGEPAGEQPIVALDTAHAPDTGDSSLPDFVQRGIEIIRSDENRFAAETKIHIVAPTNDKNLIFKVTRTTHDVTHSPDDLWHDEPESRQVESHACYVEIASPNTPPHYLLIAESLSHSEAPDILETRRRSTVSAQEAVNGGWPPRLPKQSPRFFHGNNEFDHSASNTKPTKRR